MTVEIGSVAPDFELPNQNGEKVRLSDFRGEKTVVVVFYTYAFSGICTGELCGLRDDVSDFVNDGVETLAISCDPVPTLAAYAEHHALNYQLLSDFWPHGATSRDYGVFWDNTGFATRGTFIIDPAGIVRWCVVNGPGEARSLDDYKSALSSLV
jgi:mycoredoxin-dependent peroxiredoxin